VSPLTASGAAPSADARRYRVPLRLGRARQLQALVGLRAARGVVVTVDVTSTPGYVRPVIRSFRDAQARKVFERERARKFGPDVQRRAHRELLLLNAVERLDDLRVPPGNRLERLAGDRAGQHSIRVNDQWRICFRWENGDAYDVEICDYH